MSRVYLVYEVSYDYHRFEELKHVASTMAKAKRWCKENAPSEAGLPLFYSRAFVKDMIRNEKGCDKFNISTRHYWIERRRVDE